MSVKYAVRIKVEECITYEASRHSISTYLVGRVVPPRIPVDHYPLYFGFLLYHCPELVVSTEKERMSAETEDSIMENDYSMHVTSQCIYIHQQVNVASCMHTTKTGVIKPIGAP